MRRLKSVLPLLLMAALGSAMTLPAKGQETNSVPAANGVTIETLVAEALEKNPELRFYEAELAAARAGRKTAGAFPNPEIGGDLGHKTVRGGGVREEGVAWAVSVVQPFEWPGRIGLRRTIANRDVELAELGLARFKAALAARVRTLAYGLFAAQEKAAAAREVAGRFQALRDVLVQRDPAGLTPLLELRVIEATELTAQHAANEAELATKAALLELNQLRGVATETEMAVARPEFRFGPSPGLETLLAAAGTNNFELRLRAVELAQQGFRVDLAKNERFPTISVGPSISEERAGERERVVGVGVSMPLPLWNRNTGEIEAATARRTQAEVSLAVAQRETERQVIEAALSYEKQRREMERWRPDSIEHFREAAELADRHYRLGAVAVSTYVELQKQYLEAVEALLDTKKGALESAQNIELLTGLTPSLVSTVPVKEKTE